MKIFRLISLFFLLSFLTSCQTTNKDKDTKLTKTQKNGTFHQLTPRQIEPSNKNLIQATYLKDVLPESASIYARIPNVWSLVGEASGNVFNQAFSSKPYTDALSSVKERNKKEVIPELPDEIKPLAALLLDHTTSPIEIIMMDSALEKESPIPNALLTVAINFKDIESFNHYLTDLANSSPKIEIKKTIQADGIGELSVNHLTIQIKLDLVTKRIFLLGGVKLQDNSLEESLKLLKPNSAHAMLALENTIDSSGQGLFIWGNPEKLIQLANVAGAQRELAPLAMLGVNSIKNIAVGMGTSQGINRLKFVLDMPKTGFRAFIPTIQNAPNFKLAGNTNYVVTLGLPSKSDFISIESTLGMSSSKSIQDYYDFKKIFLEKSGINIEDIFDLIGQDLSIVSDESGTYTAIRLKDKQRFKSLLADWVKNANLKYETRTLSGEEYHHLAISSMTSDLGDLGTSNNRLLKRLIGISSHIYWQQEDDYLILASLPQTLIDRHYVSQQTSATDWFKKEQRLDPKGALLMASMRNKGIPTSMYYTKLEILSYLGDFVGQPIDMFSLPSSREANLPKEGAYGIKVTSTENQLALELSYESNPVEILFASNPYMGVAVAGVIASISIPAYEDYTLRAQVAISLIDAKNVRMQLESFKLENNHYPSAEEASTLNQSRWSKKSHQISLDSNGNIVVEFTQKRLRNINLLLIKPIDGEKNWKCEGKSKTRFSRKFLPSECRNSD